MRPRSSCREEALAEKFADYAESRDKANEQIEALESQRPAPLEELAILCDVQQSPPPHHLLVRGDYRALGPEVGPGVPERMCGADCGYACRGLGCVGRRAAHGARAVGHEPAASAVGAGDGESHLAAAFWARHRVDGR